MKYELNKLYGYSDNFEIINAVNDIKFQFPNKIFTISLSNSNFKIVETV